MIRINLSYQNYVEKEGKNRVLYLILSKVLCNILTAALFWYELLTTTLIKNGFKLNSYDLCTVNSIIKEK